MAEIEILMPVYRGAEFLPETLRSVRAQTGIDLEVQISVEPGDTPSLDLCRQAAKEDTRIHVTAQPERLGWPGNFTWLLKRARAPFVIYWQQDDHASSGYLRALLDCLSKHPEASLAATDVQFFGDRFDHHPMQPVDGTPLARVLDVVEQTSFVGLRGLIRRSHLPDPDVTFRATRDRSQSAEFVFLAALAAHGPMLRCADALYFKRGHPEAETHNLLGLPPHRARRAWANMGAGLLRVALAHAGAGTEGRLLETIVDRLTIDRPGRGFAYLAPQTPQGVADVALVLADEAGIDLGDDRWEPGAATGLERPVHPHVIEALAALRIRSRRLHTPPAGRYAGPALDPVLGWGWHPVEEWGAWTDGALASIELGPRWPGGTVTIEGHAFVIGRPVRVGWSLTGDETVTDEIDAGEPLRWAIEVARDVRRIQLHAPDAHSPAQARLSHDERSLGIGLHAVELRPAR